MYNIIKSSLWEFVDFQSCKNHSFGKSFYSTIVNTYLSRKRIEYVFFNSPLTCFISYNYWDLWHMDFHLNSCHILPSVPSFSPFFSVLLCLIWPNFSLLFLSSFLFVLTNIIHNLKCLKNTSSCFWKQIKRTPESSSLPNGKKSNLGHYGEGCEDGMSFCLLFL